MKTGMNICCIALAFALQAKEPVEYIDPMIGATTTTGGGGHGLGKTFPGAATPFGMVQLSPDTITGGDNGPGYSSHHTTIEGFSFTHLSGIGWYGDLGNFQVMAATGPREFDRDKAKSDYSHTNETASAGYYRVMLQRYGIEAEMTAAPRAGILRFTFPKAETARIQIDLGRRIGQKERWLSHSVQQVKVVNDRTIEGFMYCPHEDGGWGRGGGKVTYTHYFRTEFSVPLKKFGVWDKDRVIEGAASYTGTNTGFFVEFATEAGQQVLVKSGVSYVSIAGARANLAHDIPGWDFEGVRARARGLWAEVVDSVSVEGGTEDERTIFATALYHVNLDPRSISDVTGDYPGADGKPARTTNFTYRTVFSGWDVFRSQYPLLTLIRPDVVSDSINSLTELAQKSGRGYFERWELLNTYTGCMLGNPAISVLADAYVKGIRGYPVEQAYAIAVVSSDRFTNQPRGFTPGSMSWTLENAYTDWCMSRLAEQLGRTNDVARYRARALAYTNLWDPEKRWFRTRTDKGFIPWLERTAHAQQGTVESNPYQQGWFVPQDVEGFIALMGEEHFVRDLTEFFEKTPADFLWNDYYNHPNEPCHHIAFLFNAAGRPWLTQKWSRRICAGAYKTGVKGLCGNDDVGQMSAWYVLAAAGIYPVCPGDGIWQITSPVFSRITFRLGNGRTFVIAAANNSAQNIYIQSARLNGRPIDRAWLRHSELTAGGRLDLVMGREPNMKWASEIESRPPNPFRR